MRISDFRDQIRRCEERYRRNENQRERRKRHAETLGRGGDWREVDDADRIFYRLSRLGLTEAAGRAMAAVEIEPPEEEAPAPSLDVLERIIGGNQLLDAFFLIRGAAVRRAVGRVAVRSASGSVVGFGTGFLISPRLLMTNNHVLENAASAQVSSIQFNFFQMPDGSMSSIIEHDLEPGTFFETDPDLDFTIVAVEPENAAGHRLANLGWMPLIRQSGKAIVGEAVNIPQHPGGEPQQLALRQNTISDTLDDFLHYTADTERGSSGSPVLNDQWELAALHHAGVPDRDEQDRILLVDGTPWDGGSTTMGQIKWVANEGARISRIVNLLDSRQASFDDLGRELYQEAFLSPPPLELSPTADRPAPGTEPSGPTVKEGGKAVWTIPLRVTVDLGDSSAPRTAPDRAVSAPAIRRGRPTPPPEDPELQRILARVKENQDRPYLDAVQDEADKNNYYGSLPANLSKKKRFQRLHELLTDTHEHVFSYRAARLEHLYPWVDLRPDRKLRSIYSGQGFEPEEIIRLDFEVAAARERRLNEILAGEGAVDEERFSEILDQLEASLPFNCEHVVPQSWFDKAQPMRADLHHLFACESGCNSFRSNIPYFQFAPEDEVVRDACGRRETDERKFEPVAGKGPAARATLYFLLRYPGKIGDEGRELQAERLDKVLLQWHRDHPVTDYERHRNAGVFGVQGNRNPLIDFPEMADKIDFSLGFGG